MTRISFHVFLMAATIGLCIADDFGPKKCKCSEEDKEIFQECFREVIEKDFDLSTFMDNLMNDDQSAALRLCFAKKHGVVDEEGKYNAEKSKEGMEAAEFEDDTIKAAVMEDMAKCDEDPGHDDVPALLKCQEEAFMKHCLPTF